MKHSLRTARFFAGLISAWVFCFLSLAGCSVPAEGIYHRVEKGQTLYRISRTYGVDEIYLARVNGISDPTRLEAGQLVYIPGVDRTRSIPSPSAKSSPPETASSRPPSLSPKPPSPLAAPKPRPEPSPVVSAKKGDGRPTAQNPPPAPISRPEGKASTAVKGKFSWPVKGKIVRGFGANGLESCKGLEIAISPGTAVLSAAAGKVTYSGDGIRGYGNLIILKHDESYFTVYAFNQKNLVSAGSFVGKGERIALSGTSGAEGRLHFEIRKGKTAVNPIFYLP